MNNPISSEIKVRQLNFNDEIIRRFSSLAMSVELNERKRFSVTKTVSQLIELLNVAKSSTHHEVAKALFNLVALLDHNQKSFLSNLGADFEDDITSKKQLDVIEKKYIHGARG